MKEFLYSKKQKASSMNCNRILQQHIHSLKQLDKFFWKCLEYQVVVSTGFN